MLRRKECDYGTLGTLLYCLPTATRAAARYQVLDVSKRIEWSPRDHRCGCRVHALLSPPQRTSDDDKVMCNCKLHFTVLHYTAS